MVLASAAEKVCVCVFYTSLCTCSHTGTRTRTLPEAAPLDAPDRGLVLTSAGSTEAPVLCSEEMTVGTHGGAAARGLVLAPDPSPRRRRRLCSGYVGRTGERLLDASCVPGIGKVRGSAWLWSQVHLTCFCSTAVAGWRGSLLVGLQG